MNDYHEKLAISPSPHRVSNLSTTRVMASVLIALIPAFAVGIYEFGYRAATLTIVCISSCVVFEFLFNKIMKKQQTVGDLSAVVTGALLAVSLPSSLPYWMAIVGAFMAIIVFKQLFGGLGQNIVNPAITARLFLFIAFASDMTTWVAPRGAKGGDGVDAVSSATPLMELSHGSGLESVSASNMDLFLGNVGGCLGEVSALAIMAGGIFLIAYRVVSWHIPVTFLATVFVIGLFWGGMDGAIFQVCSGGVMIGAFFCAPDYVTSPTSPMGKIIFGIGCGLFTMLIRLFASYPEGVSFAILLMNILTVYIDRFCEYRYIKKYEHERR